MKLLLTGAFPYTKDNICKIKEVVGDVAFIQDERQPFDSQGCSFQAEEIEGIICNSFFVFNDIKKFKNLKYIQLLSAGMDRVPLYYIKGKNIKINNAKGVYSKPMADWVVGKTLEIYKDSKNFYDNQRNKSWIKNRNLLELTGKNLCILGYGSVGSEIARLMKPFDVIISALDIAKIEDENIDYCFNVNEMNRYLAFADIIVVSLPLNNETKHILNKNRFSQLKEGCVLINISRGSIICENALIEAIKENKFRGVALDVFEEEPLPKESPLWDFKNVIITPHNSYVSNKTNDRLFALITKNLECIGVKI